MLRDGVVEQRHRFDVPGNAPELPVFDELRQAGMTEWMGWLQPLGELSPQIGSPTEVEHAERSWLVF